MRKTKKILTLIFPFFILFMGSVYSQYECEVIDANSTSSVESECSRFDLDADKVSKLPLIKIKVAFHFRAREDGENFTCDRSDPRIDNGFWLLYAPHAVYHLLNGQNGDGGINGRMSHGIVLSDGTEIDANIRFEKFSGGSNLDCSDIYLYDHNEPFVPVDGALNIYFADQKNNQGDWTLTIRGWTWFGSSVIHARNFLNNVLNGYTQYWVYSTLIGHEFGHTQNLHHSFYCNNPCNGVDIDAAAECCGSCVNQPSTGPGCHGCGEALMMGYGQAENLTECEIDQLWNYLLNNPASFQYFEDCKQINEVKEVFDYNDHVVWTNKQIFNSDIIIKSGTTIEAQCDVLMGYNRRIIVEDGAKFIVNGGRVTSICPDIKWQGIKVTGGNPDFDVKLVDAIIENTSGAAVSMMPPLPWPEMKNHGNGILHAENTVFNNTQRMVAFISFKPLPNGSYIRNCTQNGGVAGITNWNCGGIVVENNEINVTHWGIGTEHGGFDIIDNEINTIHQPNILFAPVYPNLSSQVVGNILNSETQNMVSMGATKVQSEAKRNTFNQLSGMNYPSNLVLEGHSYWKIEDNDFYGSNQYNSYAVQLSETGGGGVLNWINANEFLNPRNGAIVLGNNEKALFTNNCFETVDFDLGMEHARIHPFQAQGPNTPANNCFSKSNGSSVYMFSSAPFIYMVPNDNIYDCRDYISGPQISIIPGKDIDNECMGGIPPGGEEQICLMTKQEYEQAIAGMDDEHPLKAYYERCYVNWLQANFQKYQEDFDFLAEAQFLEGQIDPSNKFYDDLVIYKYAALMHAGEYSDAINYLNSISNVSSKLVDFKTVQQIYHKRVKNYSYTPTANELNVLYTIAHKDHSYSAYAKSLYFHFTEQLLLSEPTQEGNNLGFRSDELVKATKSIDVFPNPVSDVLMVETSGYESVMNIKLYDVQGRLLLEEKFTKNSQINVSDLGSGVLFYEILDPEKNVERKGKVLRME